MFFSNNPSLKLYDRLSDLEEKLLKSEAERKSLEAKFQILAQTYSLQEERKLDKLKTKYLEFLDDFRERSKRNEDILKSLQRVESGANAVYAKTERLKQLRSHYDAYLSRAVPLWRHPDVLRLEASESTWIKGQRLSSLPMLPHYGAAVIMEPQPQSSFAVHPPKDHQGSLGSLGDAGRRMLQELSISSGKNFSPHYPISYVYPPPYHMPMIPVVPSPIPYSVPYPCNQIDPRVSSYMPASSPVVESTPSLKKNNYQKYSLTKQPPIKENIRYMNVTTADADLRKKSFSEIECLKTDNNIPEGSGNLSDDEVLDLTPKPNLTSIKPEKSTAEINSAHELSIKQLKSLLNDDDDDNVGADEVNNVYPASMYQLDEDVPEDFIEQNYVEEEHNQKYERDVSRNVILEEDEEEEVGYQIQQWQPQMQTKSALRTGEPNLPRDQDGRQDMSRDGKSHEQMEKPRNQLEHATYPDGKISSRVSHQNHHEKQYGLSGYVGDDDPQPPSHGDRNRTSSMEANSYKNPGPEERSYGNSRSGMKNPLPNQNQANWQEQQYSPTNKGSYTADQRQFIEVSPSNPKDLAQGRYLDQRRPSTMHPSSGLEGDRMLQNNRPIQGRALDQLGHGRPPEVGRAGHQEDYPRGKPTKLYPVNQNNSHLPAEVSLQHNPNAYSSEIIASGEKLPAHHFQPGEHEEYLPAAEPVRNAPYEDIDYPHRFPQPSENVKSGIFTGETISHQEEHQTGENQYLSPSRHQSDSLNHNSGENRNQYSPNNQPEYYQDQILHQQQLEGDSGISGNRAFSPSSQPKRSLPGETSYVPPADHQHENFRNESQKGYQPDYLEDRRVGEDPHLLEQHSGENQNLQPHHQQEYYPEQGPYVESHQTEYISGESTYPPEPQIEYHEQRMPPEQEYLSGENQEPHVADQQQGYYYEQSQFAGEQQPDYIPVEDTNYQEEHNRNRSPYDGRQQHEHGQVLFQSSHPQENYPDESAYTDQQHADQHQDLPGESPYHQQQYQEQGPYVPPDEERQYISGHQEPLNITAGSQQEYYPEQNPYDSEQLAFVHGENDNAYPSSHEQEYHEQQSLVPPGKENDHVTGENIIYSPGSQQDTSSQRERSRWPNKARLTNLVSREKKGPPPKSSVINQLADSESESYQVEQGDNVNADDSDFDFSIGK